MKGKQENAFFIKAFIKRSLIVLILGSILTAITLMNFYQTYVGLDLSQRPNAWLVFSTSYIIMGIYLFVLGVSFSYYEYPGLISIYANRKNNLRQMLLVGTVGTTLLEIINGCITSLFTLGARYLCPAASVKNSVFDDALKEVQNLQLGSIFASSIKEEIGIGLFVFALGFLIGSLFYRLKASSAVCILSILPIFLALSFIAEMLFNTQITTLLMLSMLMLIKPMVSFEGQVVYSALFYIGAYALLRKAPIKTYAHDLL